MAERPLALTVEATLESSSMPNQVPLQEEPSDLMQDGRLGETGKSDVVVMALNGETVLQATIDDEHTVLQLKQDIEQIVHVPVVGQHLTRSDSGVVLCNRDKVVIAHGSDVPLLLTLTTVLRWTDTDIETIRKELDDAIQNDDMKEAAAILARMPIYDEDKVKVLGVEPDTSILMGTISAWYAMDDAEPAILVMKMVNRLSPELQKKLVLPAVCNGVDGNWRVDQWTAWIIEYASKEMKADREIVLAASTQGEDLFEFAADGLKADHDFVLALVQLNGRALQYAAEEMKAQRDIVLAAVRQDGLALDYASTEMKSEPEVCLAAFQRMGIEFAADEINDLGAIFIRALASHEVVRGNYWPRYGCSKIMIWAWVPENLKTNDHVKQAGKMEKEDVLAAVREGGADGTILKYVAADMKADNDVVMAAVQLNPDALKYAAEELTNNDAFLAEVGPTIKLPMHPHTLVHVGCNWHVCDLCWTAELLQAYRCAKCDFDVCETCRNREIPESNVS